MSFARDSENLVLALALGARRSVNECFVWNQVEWVGFTPLFWVRLNPSHVWLEGWSCPRFLFGSKENGCGLRILACGPCLSLPSSPTLLTRRNHANAAGSVPDTTLPR